VNTLKNGAKLKSLTSKTPKEKKNMRTKSNKELWWLTRVFSGLLIVFFLFSEVSLFAQDTLFNGKALNIPTQKYGISIGNSYEFTGVRINFADKNAKKINGLNVTFWIDKFENEDAILNAISIGVFPVAGKMQPINIGLLGVGTAKNNLNGLSIGGIVIGSNSKINGLSLSGLVTMADGESSAISGITLSGIGIGAHKAINGLAFGGFAVGTDGEINGIASSLSYISAEKKIQGMAITLGYLKSEIFNGIALAGYTKTNQMNGLSVAIFNRTEDLHGIQLGLINFVKNNRKWSRILPLINFHF
jgi:hypothetical protein